MHAVPGMAAHPIHVSSCLIGAGVSKTASANSPILAARIASGPGQAGGAWFDRRSRPHGASSRPHSRWLASPRCCFGRSSILTSRTIRSTSWSSASSALSRSCLGYAAGEAANRRGDARVLLLSLAFMATGGFLLAPRHRDAQRPLLRGARRLPGRDSGRAPGERGLRGGLGVRRRPSRNRGRAHSPADTASTGACWSPWACGSSGRVANLPPLGGPDSEAATSRARHRDRGPRNDHVRGQRRAVLEHLPSQPQRCFPAAVDRLLPVAIRGDDRRRGHRGAQVARELVGVARPDRHGLPDRRLGCSSRMARRAVPAALPADDAGAPPGRERPLRRSRRVHGLRRALIAGRGCSRARRVLGHRGAADHAVSSAARSRSSSATASWPRSTAEATSPTTRCEHARAALALQRRLAAPRRAASGLAAHARWRQQRRGDRSRDRRRRPRRLPLGGRHGQYRRAPRESGSRPAEC